MTRKLAYWISTVITAISLLGALSYLTGSEQVVCLVRLPDSLYAYAPAVQVGKIEQPTRPIDVDADQCPVRSPARLASNRNQHRFSASSIKFSSRLAVATSSCLSASSWASRMFRI